MSFFRLAWLPHHHPDSDSVLSINSKSILRPWSKSTFGVGWHSPIAGPTYTVPAVAKLTCSKNYLEIWLCHCSLTLPDRGFFCLASLNNKTVLSSLEFDHLNPTWTNQKKKEFSKRLVSGGDRIRSCTAVSTRSSVQKGFYLKMLLLLLKAIVEGRIVKRFHNV